MGLRPRGRTQSYHAENDKEDRVLPQKPDDRALRDVVLFLVCLRYKIAGQHGQGEAEEIDGKG